MLDILTKVLLWNSSGHLIIVSTQIHFFCPSKCLGSPVSSYGPDLIVSLRKNSFLKVVGKEKNITRWNERKTGLGGGGGSNEHLCRRELKAAGTVRNE